MALLTEAAPGLMVVQSVAPVRSAFNVRGLPLAGTGIRGLSWMFKR
jgi:hypothetical protein